MSIGAFLEEHFEEESTHYVPDMWIVVQTRLHCLVLEVHP